MASVKISIQVKDFDPGLAQSELGKDSGVGGIVTFTGLVRDNNLDDPVRGCTSNITPA